jgi:hypothetical protein
MVPNMVIPFGPWELVTPIPYLRERRHIPQASQL